MRKFLLSLLLFLPVMSSSAIGADPLRKVAKQFGNKIRPMKNPRVGILSFPYHNGKISSGSSILSERLTTYMAEIKGVRLIERNLLKKILEEQHLSETGVVDAESAQQMGKVLGLDIIITGTLYDLNNKQTELNARVLQANTGEVLTASQIVVDRIWSDSPKMPKPMTTTSTIEPDEEKPSKNEAIEIGFPGGRGGRFGRGGYYGGGGGGSGQ